MTSSNGNIFRFTGPQREDDADVDRNEVCDMHDYVVNVSSCIGFEDGIISVEAAPQKHSRHSGVMMIKDNFTETKMFSFYNMSPCDISHNLESIDVKKATWYDYISGKTYAPP